jgi:hypothetical protein
VVLIIYLIIFIAGMIFADIAQPLLEGLGSLVLTWIEARKAKSNEKVAGS